jgi:hypothetical protein
MNEEAFVDGKLLYDPHKDSRSIPLRHFDARKPTFDSKEVSCVQHRIFSFDYGLSLFLTPPASMSASVRGKRSIDLDSPRKVPR